MLFKINFRSRLIAYKEIHIENVRTVLVDASNKIHAILVQHNVRTHERSLKVNDMLLNKPNHQKCV